MEFDPDSVPDDVWISIFETLPPAQLTVLVRTCQRFRALARKPLLREIRWGRTESTERNLDAWSSPSYSDLVALPRKVAIGIDFEFCGKSFWNYLTDEMQLHDRIHTQLQNFSMLHELVLNGTAISPYTYTILASLPSLRSLSIVNCVFINLHTQFEDHTHPNFSRQPTPLFNFTSLPLTSLRLHKLTYPTEPGPGVLAENIPSHPIHLVTAPNLRWLSLTWTPSRAVAYAHNNWPLPNVTDLEVIMSFLTRDMVDALVGCVERCRPGVRISLSIDHHNLAEQQVTSGFHIPLKGVWKYRGPLSFATWWPRGDGASTLTHLVTNVAIELSPLVSGLEKLPKSLQALEVQLRKWDMELLYAVRELFPDIRTLVVRYGQGTLPVDFLVSLGAEILPKLTYLHSLKILHDASCLKSRLPNHSTNMTGFFGPPVQQPTPLHQHLLQLHHQHPPHPQPLLHPPAQHQHQLPHPPHPHPPHQFHQHHPPQLHHHHHPYHPPPPPPPPTQFQHHHWLLNNNTGHLGTPHPLTEAALEEFSSRSDDDDSGPPELEQADLKDYLVAWNRYCKRLRHVQLDNARWWERKFEGDVWVEIKGPDVT
ncbi:hypothetical protein CPB84DRAFT_1798218 [Gymnopilus junonius]|uniref:F-box domain-containing protein n=1 Tax=Gymnopilus junonius TaxID=109634 RepID=A0A9P5N8H0_GYMJU|nr:hypothetical protein CPB84DRAFT_1798218 [Gymnopilus junonius]